MNQKATSIDVAFLVGISLSFQCDRWVVGSKEVWIRFVLDEDFTGTIGCNIVGDQLCVNAAWLTITTDIKTGGGSEDRARECAAAITTQHHGLSGIGIEVSADVIGSEGNDQIVACICFATCISSA